MLNNDICYAQFNCLFYSQLLVRLLIRIYGNLIKSKYRSIESDEDVVLIFYDTIIEKQWTDKNEIISYQVDYSKGRLFKGIHLLNLIFHYNGISLSLSFHIVKKFISYCDLHTRQIKHESRIS